MTLPPRVKESIKTALAITIAYGIALSMDWDRPYWAGFAVAFISLSTIGQSLNKGAMRMLGTLLALTMSLLIIGLFVQDRWWFMVALSAWIGFCTYRMGVSRHSYFWYLAGFASAIIAFDGGFNPINAFDTAMIRAQETGLGILVYTLITTLLWPTNSRVGFKGATRALVKAQHQLYLSCRAAIADCASEQGESDQNMQAVSARQALTQFGIMLEAALADSYGVRELRRQWRRFQEQSTVLLVTLERLHDSRKELSGLDLNGLLPKFGAAVTEIEQRFAEIERLLAGESLQHQPRMVDLSIDQARLHELSPFNKAALALFRTGLQRLDELTREQFDTVIDITDPGTSTSQSAVSSKPSDKQDSGLLPDIDNMIAAIRVMAGMWLAYFLWIYFRVPGGSGLVSGIVPIGMTLAINARLPVLIILKPTLSVIAVAGILYVFVMPHLSSYIGLGTMIFLFVFAAAYLFSAPQQGIKRAISLAFFMMVIDVSNSSQSYSILPVINTALMFIMLTGVLILASHFPYSPQPDKVFSRLLGRFFRSSEYLMTTMRRDLTLSRLDCWRQAFHARELATLPQKLGDWGKVINTRVLSDTTPEQLQILTSNLQTLTYSMQELLDARANPQGELLVRELLTDVRVWRLQVQETLQRFHRVSDLTHVDVLREQLTTSIEHLEGRIEETLNKAGEGEFSERDGENFYHLLGAYRGLSEAIIEYAATAEGIRWNQWRESRFLL